MSRSYRRVDTSSVDFRNCARKMAWKTAKEARTAAKRINRAHKHDGYETLKAYHCPVCGQHHHTKKKNRERV